MTPAELIARARELDAAATPGPWYDPGPSRLGLSAGVREQCGLIAIDPRANEPDGQHNRAFIAESRQLLPVLATALEQSDNALAAAKAGESYALAELAKLRHEIVCFQRDTRTVLDIAHKMQEVRARAAADLPNWDKIMDELDTYTELLSTMQIPKGTK